MDDDDEDHHHHQEMDARNGLTRNKPWFNKPSRNGLTLTKG